MDTYHLKILKIVDEGKDIKSFYLEKPPTFIFSPGQYCFVGSRVLPHEYSPMAIASGTKEESLLFTIRKGNEVTNRLFELKEGDTMLVSEPKGTAIPLTKLAGTKVLCIAGGTGITPIRSLMKSLEQGEVTILYGTENKSTIPYKDEIKTWNAKIIFQKDTPTGNVTDLIQTTEHQFAFVVGPTPMIQATITKLNKIGWKNDKIFVSIEKYLYNKILGPVFPVNELEKLKTFLIKLLPKETKAITTEKD